MGITFVIKMGPWFVCQVGQMKKKAAPILIAIMMEKRVTMETVPNLKHVPAKLVGKKILALNSKAIEIY